ncbi:MAG TPA: hypothetical protein V6C85_09295 [Allocoleopsis sp.]
MPSPPSPLSQSWARGFYIAFYFFHFSNSFAIAFLGLDDDAIALKSSLS